VNLYVGGTDIASKIRPGSLRGGISLQGRMRLSFATRAASVSIDIGDPVRLFVDRGNIFIGFVESIRSKAVVQGLTRLEQVVECADLHQITDRRLVNETYTGQTVDQVIADLVTTYLDDEGIWYTPSTYDPILPSSQIGAIQITPTYPLASGSTTLEDLELDYVTMRSVLDAIADEIGCYWRITPDRQLLIQSTSGTSSPWDVDGTYPVQDVARRQGRKNFANRVYYTYDRIQTFTYELIELEYTGETPRSWDLTYPINTLLGVTAVYDTTLPYEERYAREASATDGRTIALNVTGEGLGQPSASGNVSIQSDSAAEGTSKTVTFYGYAVSGGTDYFTRTLALNNDSEVTDVLVDPTWYYITAVEISESPTGNVTVTAPDGGGGTTVCTFAASTSDLTAGVSVRASGNMYTRLLVEPQDTDVTEREADVAGANITQSTGEVGIVSDDAGDTTQSVTIYGVKDGTTSGVDTASETLDGTTYTTLSVATWDVIFAVVIDSAPAGTVTVTWGATTIATFADAGNIGIYDVSDTDATSKYLSITPAADYGEVYVGVKGLDDDSNVQYDFIKLTDDSTVYVDGSWPTVTELYVGGYSSSQDITLSSMRWKDEAVTIVGTDIDTDAAQSEVVVLTNGQSAYTDSPYRTITNVYQGALATNQKVNVIAPHELVYRTGDNRIWLGEYTDNLDPTASTYQQGYRIQYTWLDETTSYRDVSGAAYETIADMQALEDPDSDGIASGRYESRITFDESLTATEALAKATPIANRYGVFTDEITFRCWRAGLVPGQQIAITDAALGLSADNYLITSVEFVDMINPANGELQYSVTCATGPAVGEWLNTWRSS